MEIMVPPKMSNLEFFLRKKLKPLETCHIIRVYTFRLQRRASKMLFYFKNLVILSLTLSTFGQTQRLQSYQNETEIFFNNCLKGYQIINQANKTPDKYYSCQTNPNGVQLETLLSTDSKKRYFCVKYVKNINSPQDFDTLEFFTNSEFKLSYVSVKQY